MQLMANTYGWWAELNCLRSSTTGCHLAGSMDNNNKDEACLGLWRHVIRKTCPCIVYPLIPHRGGGSNVYPQSMF